MISAETEKKLAVLIEMAGNRKPSEPVLAMFLETLDQYGDEAVSKAIDRCSRECKGWIAPSDVIQRIDDGRPGPDEAWALCPTSEAESTVWTEEIAQAFETVRLMRDRIAARRSFIETYSRVVAEARASGFKVKWVPSLGNDPSWREKAITDAVAHGRLSRKRAELLLPGFGEPQTRQLPSSTGPVDVQAIIKGMSLDVKNLGGEK
jgi:hypothetical protein